MSPYFGVVPNGIPHALQFNATPDSAERPLSGDDSVAVELLDIYGERVVQRLLSHLQST